MACRFNVTESVLDGFQQCGCQSIYTVLSVLPFNAASDKALLLSPTGMFTRVYVVYACGITVAGMHQWNIDALAE